MKGQNVLCALCLAQPAVLYCKNDDANLCTKCDTQYHSSNPLAARHERVPLAACMAPECSSAVPACSDSDLAVVPEFHAPASPLASFDDASLGMGGAGSGLLMPGALAMPGDDLLFDLSGGTLLDFDLSDLLDFSAPSTDDCTVPQLQPEALVPSIAAPGPVAAPAQQPASLTSSQAAFGLQQAPAPMVPSPAADFSHLHMVPQMPAAAVPQHLPALIPVPSTTLPVAVPKAEPQQEAVGVVAKQAAQAQAAGIMAEVPMTRAERVARYLEKKKRRNFKKVIRYQSRKAYAEVRPRIKGRFATPAEVAAMKAAEAAKLAAQQAHHDMDDVAVVPAC